MVEPRHQTGIQWTWVPGYVGATWNPTTGCTRVSPGCDHCYAFTLHDQRFVANRAGASDFGMAAAALRLQATVPGSEHLAGAMPFPAQYDRPFSQVQMLDDRRLTEPLRTRRPHAYFVDSMADLFHEDVPDAFLDRVFAVMALSPQHIFMVLTKRPERMRAYNASARNAVGDDGDASGLPARYNNAYDAMDDVGRMLKPPRPYPFRGAFPNGLDWPLPNVWLGVSVEDQATADARIPLLLQTPAAVRFVSAEPLLSHVGFDEVWLLGSRNLAGETTEPRLDWLIVGGESGPDARACDLAWLRFLRDQCRAAHIPYFCKQLGARPVESHGTGATCCEIKLRDRKGGSMEEWPEDLRVREFPA